MTPADDLIPDRWALSCPGEQVLQQTRNAAVARALNGVGREPAQGRNVCASSARGALQRVPVERRGEPVREDPSEEGAQPGERARLSAGAETRGVPRPPLEYQALPGRLRESSRQCHRGSGPGCDAAPGLVGVGVMTADLYEDREIALQLEGYYHALLAERPQ